MSPLSFSVVIPCYNRRATIGKALDSVRAQTLAPLEVIVVDDASRDGSADWVRANHPEVQLIALSRNRGAAGARNAALEVARGDVVAFLDSDDWWEPGYLEVLARLFAQHPSAVMAASDIHMVLDYGERQTYVHRCRPSPEFPDITDNLLVANFIATMSCVAVRRAAIDSAGPLREELRVTHDHEWYIRLSTLGGVVCTEQPLVWRTIGHDNLVSDLGPFLRDQLRFLRGFFASALGRRYVHRRWESYARMFEQFAGMAHGRRRYWAAARHHFSAFACTCMDLRPRWSMLAATLRTGRGAARANVSAALRRIR